MAPRTQAVTILFCDLVASTERRARMGDDDFDEFSARYVRMLRATIAQHGGREVSSAGDGLMVVFTESVVAAVACAIDMHDGMPALDPSDPPKLRVGISTGEVAQDGDNYSGMPIVEAARLEASAAPGQTLANAVVRALVGTRRAIRFRDVGLLTLKGLPEPLAAVALVTDDSIEVPITVPHVERPAKSRRRGPLVGAVVALVVVLVAGLVAVTTRSSGHHAAASTTPPTTPHNYPVSYTPKSCPQDAPKDISGLTCATLTVPEDRAHPNGRVVKLDVFHAPARTNPSPGEAVVDFGADDLAGSPARDHRDEYQLGQRGGAGEPRSTPTLTCPEFTKVEGDALLRPSDDVTQQELESQALRACHDRLSKSFDLNAYNYLTMGEDMADLIRAIHVTHVDIVSGYVATISAIEVTRELPGVVRTLTLQEPVPGGASAYSDPTGELAAGFNSYVALCNADTTCKTSYPDLRASLRHAYNVYRSSPRIAHGDSGQGATHDVLIDGPRVALAIAGGLADDSDYNLLAAGIAAPDRTSAIDALTAGRIIYWKAQFINPNYAWGTQMSFLCSYDQYTVTTGHALSANAVPELAGIDDGFVTWACRSWSVQKLAQVAFDNAHTDIPTLVVSGDLAPASDQRWPTQFQRELPHATVAEFPSLGGDVLANNDPACLADLRRRFLDDPAATLDVGGCTRQSPPIKFVGS